MASINPDIGAAMVTVFVAAVASILTSFAFRAWERRADHRSAMKRYGVFLHYAAKSLKGVIC